MSGIDVARAMGAAFGPGPDQILFGTIAGVGVSGANTVDVYLSNSAVGVTPTAATGLAYISGYNPVVGDGVAILHGQGSSKTSYLVIGTVAGGSNGGGSSGVPIGAIQMFPVLITYPNWLLCNGATFSAVTYPALYNLLGSTTLPDLRDTLPMGAHTIVSLGATAGSQTANGLLAHSHTESTHTHTESNHSHTESNHTHSGDPHTHSHNHSGPSHTHTGPSHTHGTGNSGGFITAQPTGGSLKVTGGGVQFPGVSTTAAGGTGASGSGGTGNTSTDSTGSSIGTTGSGGPGSTNSAGSGSSNGPGSPTLRVAWLISGQARRGYMTYGLSQYIAANPATGLIVGQEVSAWIGSRFSPVNTPPATNGAPPSGSPDYGPTATTSIAGCAFAVTTTDEFILSVYDPADTSNGGTYNTYWYGPYLIDPSTNLVGWTSAVDQTANREILSTTIASGSNGAALPQTTISIASTIPGNPDNFLTAGIVGIIFGTFTNPTSVQIVTYTGLSGGDTLTGCAGGTGTLSTGQHVFVLYQNSNYRRECTVSVSPGVQANGDGAYVVGFSTVAGSLRTVARTGITYNTAAAPFYTYAQLRVPVDPLGFYGVLGLTQGSTGSLTATANPLWLEVDF